MAHLLYGLFVTLAAALALPFLWRRDERGARAERLTLRLPSVPEGGAWVLLSSVGEAKAAEPLLREIRKKYPNLPLLASAFTATGRASLRATGLTGMLVLAPPLDIPFLVRRMLRALRPRLIVLVEGEIWPSLLREAERKGIPVVLVNGRLTERAAGRWRRFPRFSATVWGRLSLALAREEADAARMRALGVPEEKLRVAGNVKFDFDPPTSGEAAARAKKIAAGRNILVAGSVRAGEEAPVLAAFAAVKREIPGVVLFLAPRHPEKSEDAFRAEAARGRLHLMRWMEQEGIGGQGLGISERKDSLDSSTNPYTLNPKPSSSNPSVDVVWVDALGVLVSLYEAADAVFVGGSLLPLGGHNVLEPAYFGKAIVTGPHMENFLDAAAALRSEEALLEARSPEELAALWARLLRDERGRRETGERARVVVESRRGATRRCLDALIPFLEPRTRQGRD